MAEAYDPAEIEDRPTRSHLSRKDLKVIGIALIILMILMSPIYMILKQQRDKHLCKKNFEQVYKALAGYAIDNNDRFPPLFVEEDGEPGFPNGNRQPYTWMSLVQDGMSRRATFECPSADPSEHVWNLPNSTDHKPFPSDMGMYKPWATWNQTMISDPDRAILITETSNGGANGTFDPKPYSHKVDGMAICWDDGNDAPTNLSEYVTRLAFRNTKSKNFIKSGETRHAEGNHAITVAGNLVHLKPNAARIQRVGTGSGEIEGLWATR